MSDIINKIECPACRDTEYRFVNSHSGYRILVCLGCKLLYADPMLAGDSSYYKQHFVYKDTTETAVLKRCHAVNTGANRRLLGMVPRGSRIMDIGCGSGAFVYYALRRGYDAYGIDFDDKQINAGKKFLNLGERLILGDLEEIGIHIGPNKKFKLITMFEVIEHMANPRRVMQSLRELLDEGGLIVISCPNEARWQPIGRVFADYPPHHLTRWRPETLVNFLQREGFDHLRTEIESSLSDIFWAAYVNHIVKRKIGSGNQGASSWEKIRLSVGSMFKRVSVNVLQIFLTPFDLILRMEDIGTRGMRVIGRKK